MVKHVFNSLETIKYSFLKEEELIQEKNVIIIWNNYVNFVNKDIFFNIKDSLLYQDKIKAGDYIVIGISDNFEENKKILQEDLEIRIFEYENSDTILFERA